MIFFVKRFAKLYGEKHLTFKLHCQLHLIKQVKQFGSLHRYSCFPFEGYFSVMQKFIHGTRGFVNQVYKNHSFGITVTKIPSILVEKDYSINGDESNFNSRVKNFYNSTNKEIRLFRRIEINNIDSNIKIILTSLDINITGVKACQRYQWKNKGIFYLFYYNIII